MAYIETYNGVRDAIDEAKTSPVGTNHVCCSAPASGDHHLLCKRRYPCCGASPDDNTGHATYCHTRTMDDEIVREMMDADVRFDREVEEHEQVETHR